MKKLKAGRKVRIMVPSIHTKNGNIAVLTEVLKDRVLVRPAYAKYTIELKKEEIEVL